MATGAFRSVIDPRYMFNGGTTASAPSWTSPTNSAQGAYGAAVNQNASDYDKIMGRYDTLFNQAQSGAGNQRAINVPQIQAQQREYQDGPGYQRSGLLTEVADRARGFADTGGYSDGDITAFRSRGLAPIRSIYSTAQENLRRNKALQGGYSPNYGAMQAKLAREQSGIIGQKTMDLNANIAERVQEGKKFGVSQMAPLAQSENTLMNQMSRANTDGRNQFNSLNTAEANRIAELNAGYTMEAERMKQAAETDWLNQAMQANAGAANLYGTTPALTNMFGNQLLSSNAQTLAGQQATAQTQQQRANTGLSLIGAVNNAPRPAGIRGAVLPSWM